MSSLCELGVPVRPGKVITSAQAAARLLAERLPHGSAVLVIGGTGLRLAVRERGLRPVTTALDRPAAVVQGYQRGIDYPMLAEGSLAVAAGAIFVASNADATLPSVRGREPGNGALFQVIRIATGRDPIVAGKPEPSMHREAMLRTGARHPLIVGDRLDTDIEGANRVDADSLLVLTGVSRASDVMVAPPHRRPSYVAADLTGLLEPHPLPTVGRASRCDATAGRHAGSMGARQAPVRGAAGDAGGPSNARGNADAAGARGDCDGAGDSGRIELTGSGDPIDAFRVLCAACWSRPAWRLRWSQTRYAWPAWTSRGRTGTPATDTLRASGITQGSRPGSWPLDAGPGSRPALTAGSYGCGIFAKRSVPADTAPRPKPAMQLSNRRIGRANWPGTRAFPRRGRGSGGVAAFRARIRQVEDILAFGFWRVERTRTRAWPPRAARRRAGTAATATVDQQPVDLVRYGVERGLHLRKPAEDRPLGVVVECGLEHHAASGARAIPSRSRRG